MFPIKFSSFPFRWIMEVWGEKVGRVARPVFNHQRAALDRREINKMALSRVYLTWLPDNT